MSSTTSNVSPRQDTFLWQGSLMEIKARAEGTGGALGVLEGSRGAYRTPSEWSPRAGVHSSSSRPEASAHV
jgi:hypothetical protein